MKAYVTPRNLALVALAVLAALPALANNYLLFVGNLTLIYIILTVGLNLLIGYTGLLAFMNGILFGVGAYATAILRLDLHLPYGVAIPVGAVCTMILGVLVALPALRLAGLYLALATVAFAQFILWVLLHWDRVTRGPSGIQVPQVDYSPLSAPFEIVHYYVTLAVVAAAVWLTVNMLRSRYGRAFVAIRESEVAAESMGIDLTRYKTLAYAVSALYAGVAGGLFAPLLGIVVPESFDLSQIIVQFAMVTVGGLGSLAGAVIGAIGLVWLQEALRAFKELQEVAFGGMILLTILFMPGGVSALLRRRFPGWREPLRRMLTVKGARGADAHGSPPR
jgi:branched-chain amino acid transport system permease protein